MSRQSTLFGLCLVGFGAIFAACGSSKDSTTATTGTTTTTTSAVACTPAEEADFAALTFSGVPACSATMYAKYGDAGFQAVNQAIGKLALSAPTDKLGTSFQTKIADANSTRQTAFAEHLLQFLEYAYGNPNAYTGPTMTASHAPLQITFSQYNYFLTGVVVPALQSVITDPNDTPDITNCFAPVLEDPNVIKTVVTCK
jgi:hypothetical protein